VLDREYVITIPGDPATKGSLRCVGRRGNRAHVLTEQLKTSGPWREKVAYWLRLKLHAGVEPRQPIGVEVIFAIRRPPSHYGTGCNTAVLKEGAPVYPVGHNTGDVDKLARSILDALQDAGTVPDDCQIVDLIARKRYPIEGWADAACDVLPWPGVRIRLYPMTT